MEQLKSISLLLLLFVSTSALAQKYIGVSVGLARNHVAGSEIDFQKKIHNNEMSARTGPTFSLFVKKELTPFVYLRYEAAYVRRGNVSPDDPLWNLNLEYVSVPFRFGVQPINSYNLAKNIQFGIEGGVSFNYTFGRATNNLSNAYAAANNTRVQQFSLSALFGGNLEYRLSSRRILFFNTTWYSDLTPLLSYESGNATYKAKNTGWLFTAGLLFPLNAKSRKRSVKHFLWEL